MAYLEIPLAYFIAFGCKNNVYEVMWTNNFFLHLNFNYN